MYKQNYIYIMNNCITCVFEAIEDCTDFLFDNINSLFDKIINEKYKNIINKNGKNHKKCKCHKCHKNRINKNYEQPQNMNMNRSSSDSNIEYSITNSNNLDSWEMLQIRLV